MKKLIAILLILVVILFFQNKESFFNIGFYFGEGGDSDGLMVIEIDGYCGSDIPCAF